MFSIIIPVFNNEKQLQLLIDGIHHHLSGYNYEVILVDDGSTDKSWEVIEQNVNVENQSVLKGIQLQKNSGQHVALLCGFNYCKGDFIITMDADLQHPPHEIKTLIERQAVSKADVVYGLYKQKQHSVARNISGFIVRKWAALFRHHSGKGTSFRIISKEVIQKIIQNHKYDFIFIDEILNWYTGSFDYVTVKHEPRTNGTSGYTFFKLIKLYKNILINYYATPLKFITWLGIIGSMVTLTLGIQFIVRKFIYGVPIGFTAIIVSILFSTSIILMVLGIIGQYIFKLFQRQNNKPIYQIKSFIQ